MASKTSAFIVIFFLIHNLILFAMAADAAAAPPASGCPPGTLTRIGVCADALSIVKARVGAVPSAQCCDIIHNIIDANVGFCLCFAARLNLLGIKVNVPVDLPLIVNRCDRQLPANFQCAY